MYHSWPADATGWCFKKRAHSQKKKKKPPGVLLGWFEWRSSTLGSREEGLSTPTPTVGNATLTREAGVLAAGAQGKRWFCWVSSECKATLPFSHWDTALVSCSSCMAVFLSKRSHFWLSVWKPSNVLPEAGAGLSSCPGLAPCCGVSVLLLSFSVYTRNNHLSDVLLFIDKSHENFWELPLFYFGTGRVIFSSQLQLSSIKWRESDRVQSNPLFFPCSPADLPALSSAPACFEIPK